MISASVPSLVTIVESKTEIEIYVSDPTHNLENGEFVIPQKLKPLSCNKKLTVISNEEGTLIKADFAGAHGRTYTVKFQK